LLKSIPFTFYNPKTKWGSSKLIFFPTKNERLEKWMTLFEQEGNEQTLQGCAKEELKSPLRCLENFKGKGRELN